MCPDAIPITDHGLIIIQVPGLCTSDSIFEDTEKPFFDAIQGTILMTKYSYQNMSCPEYLAPKLSFWEAGPRVLRSSNVYTILPDFL